MHKAATWPLHEEAIHWYQLSYWNRFDHCSRTEEKHTTKTLVYPACCSYSDHNLMMTSVICSLIPRNHVTWSHQTSSVESSHTLTSVCADCTALGYQRLENRKISRAMWMQLVLNEVLFCSCSEKKWLRFTPWSSRLRGEAHSHMKHNFMIVCSLTRPYFVIWDAAVALR